MFRLRLVSYSFGIDDKSPIYPTLELARNIAQCMLTLYKGRVRVEIYKVTDFRSNVKQLVEALGSPE